MAKNLKVKEAVNRERHEPRIKGGQSDNMTTLPKKTLPKFMFYLNREEDEMLDELAVFFKKQGIRKSRSALVREAIKEYHAKVLA